MLSQFFAYLSSLEEWEAFFPAQGVVERRLSGVSAAEKSERLSVLTIPRAHVSCAT
jgi:hypothetical protein